MNTLHHSGKFFLFQWTKYFLLFNFLAVFILTARYAKFVFPPESISGGIWLAIALISHSSFITALYFLVFLLPVILFLPRRKLLFFTAVSGACVLIFLIVLDYEVYLQYRFHLNMMVFDLMVKGGSEIFDLSAGTWISGVLILLAIVGTETGFAVLAAKYAEKTKIWMRTGYAVTALLLISAVTHFAYAAADAARYRPVTSIPRHIPFFQPLTAKGFFKKYDLLNTGKEAEAAVFDQKYRSSITYPKKDLQCSADAENSNILFIITESMRSDMFSKEITPNLYQFFTSEPSLRFLSHMSGGNGTREGIFTLFYGMFGSFWEVMETEDKGPVLIQEMLKKKYQTGIFASASLAAPPFDRTVFTDIKNLRLRSKGENSVDKDRIITEEWMQWLDKADRSRPFFGFLFYDSPHSYFFPENYQTVFRPIAEQMDYHKLSRDFNPMLIKNRYKTSLHFVDSLIGNVLKDLEEKNLLENTIIIFTGDHGQEFNENNMNFWGHGSNFTKYQIHVPLLIYWKGKMQAVYSHRTSHMDIVPTLMKEVFGCTNSCSDYSNGRNLFDTGYREWIYCGGFSQDALIEADRITVSYPVGSYEIYDQSYRKPDNAQLNISAVKEMLQQKADFFPLEN
ncbi:MAG: DUF3413 domain-containing protein [Desulfococcaceae bacterium]